MRDTSGIPSKSEQFDHAYRLPITFWGDVRIPPELKALAKENRSAKVIELGCGIGRYCRFMAKQGLATTGIDFSTVAIDRAKKRASQDANQPRFVVGDVTNLGPVTGPFDVSLDIGCFHCLDENEREKYVAELFRILKPGGTHLMWAMDTTPPPNSSQLTAEMVRTAFLDGFELGKVAASRRRIAKSHWYWLTRL
ncbi:MAG TPA: class I SAM-dependent methyltransferase [Spirochaetia bacterium]|nr:class I SAM-dependent methyltransferase [Spirochaetia bacterium]